MWLIELVHVAGKLKNDGWKHDMVGVDFRQCKERQVVPIYNSHFSL